MVEYAFSPNLYILAAMNQADASVAPLDVAFMRRWQSHVLKPDYDVLYSYFGIDRNDPLPTNCNTASDVYSLSLIHILLTWKSILSMSDLTPLLSLRRTSSASRRYVFQFALLRIVLPAPHIQPELLHSRQVFDLSIYGMPFVS